MLDKKSRSLEKQQRNLFLRGGVAKHWQLDVSIPLSTLFVGCSYCLFFGVPICPRYATSVAVQLWLQSLPSRLATGASASTLERVKEVTLEELERLEACLCSLHHGYENEHAIGAAAGETPPTRRLE